MVNQKIRIFKSIRGMIVSAIIAIASTTTMASTATAVTLQLTIENLGVSKGSFFSPVWFAFQDGSFDLFNIGSHASSGIELLSTTGFSGFEDRVPGFIDVFKQFNPGFDGTYPPPSFANLLLSSLFARSSAGFDGGVQDSIFTKDFSVTFPGNFAPGNVATKIIELNGNPANYRYFSYATKVFPSNDAFIGSDDPIEIFDSQGNFIGADFIVAGDQVLDAGVRVNDELFSSLFTGGGTRENEVIRIHPGVKPAGAGGILDAESRGQKIFVNANFKAPGYQVARIRITQVPEPATTVGLFAVSGLFILRRRFRQSV